MQFIALCVMKMLLVMSIVKDRWELFVLFLKLFC